MSIENIKKLREITGAGILDVKKALDASNNDLEKAVKWLRENGIAKAAKKLGRIAADGVVKVVSNKNKIVMLEINSETDFVASNEKFINAVDEIANSILKSKIDKSNDFDLANDLKIGKEKLNDFLSSLTSIIGEKITLRRFYVYKLKTKEKVGFYIHSNSKIGSIVLGNEIEESLLKDIAMHVAALNPLYLSKDDIPKDRFDEEVKLAKKELSKALEGKPQNVQDGMINGKVNKTLAESVLLEQVFVKDGSKKVKDLQSKGKIINFVRFEVGEGIEKKEENFAEEVKKQMQK